MRPRDDLTASTPLLPQLGFVPAVAGVGTTMLLIPIQVRLGRHFARNRSNTARHTDERVKVMGDVLSSMASVKAFAWEGPFSAVNRAVRDRQVAVIAFSHWQV
jgi:hypothetical protein